MTLRAIQNPHKNYSWFKGQTLSERLEALRQNKNAESFYDHKKAKAKLASWKSLAGFVDNTERFSRRLQLEQCSEVEFMRILGTPPEKIFPQEWKPQWLKEILKSEGEPDKQDFFSKTLGKFTERGIVSPFLPLIRYYSNSLIKQAKSIQGLQRTYVNLEQLLDIFLKSFLINFEQNIRRAVVLEVNSLRILGKLKGVTPSDRFQDFVKKCENQDYRLELLKKYPVLARYAQRDLELWVQASLEFLNYLVQDWEEIQAVFRIDSTDTLESFRPSGDTHNQGRSVVILAFESGKKVLYKPRNLDIDQCFQNFLVWCNANGLKYKLKTMKIISFEDHGWVEFIEKENTKDDQDFFDFYFRLGSLLAILYSIKTVDIHFENLVAFGAHPIIVDLETLFHTEVTPKLINSASDLAKQLINDSVMSVGILPKPSISDKGRKTFDVSGIGASVDQQAPYNVVGIDNFGRDDIRITNIPGWIPRVHNRPDDIKERPIPSDTILEGFCSTYDILKENKFFLLSDEGPLASFKKCKRRLIMRDTKRYGGLHMDAFHPDLLRDDLDRSWHWDNLWSDAIHRPVVEKFIESEFNQIQINDIPHFTVGVDGEGIVGADGTKVNGVEITSGWQSAKSRVENLSEEDKQKQSWFIRASMGEITKLTIKPLSSGSENDLLQGACEIGDEVIKNFVWHGNTASFLKVVSIMGENKSSSDAFAINDADCGIYEGTGGVILFLAYLGQESKQDKYTEAAKALLNNIKIKHIDGGNIIGISGFLGLGSLVYLYTHLAALWHDEDLLKDAEKFLDKIYPIVEDDQSFDLLTGSAGCILSILPLVAMNPYSKAKNVAIRCANYLVEKQKNGEPRWMALDFKRGLSHGFAGVAMALHELGQFIGENRYIKESLKIVEHENLLIQEGRWTDSHQLGGRCQVSWCHGAPGIALGRLAMYQTKKSDSLQQDIENSLKETRDHYWMSSHCLCHGTLGNIEPLLLAKNHPEFNDYTDGVRDSLNEVLKTIIQDGWQSLLPSQTLSLGLMTGLSGVGYSLLRFHENDKVPSILMLMGPCKIPKFHESLKKNYWRRIF